MSDLRDMLYFRANPIPSEIAFHKKSISVQFLSGCKSAIISRCNCTFPLVSHLKDTPGEDTRSVLKRTGWGLKSKAVHDTRRSKQRTEPQSGTRLPCEHPSAPFFLHPTPLLITFCMPLSLAAVRERLRNGFGNMRKARLRRRRFLSAFLARRLPHIR